MHRHNEPQDTATTVPKVYESHPPAWLPQAHATADLGYLGFYPPRPEQEAELHPEYVKKGFFRPPPVSGETNSGLGVQIDERLKSEDTISKLERLMNLVFMKRAERLPSIPHRQTWFADLANPDVPLAKLGKSVPHSVKGHDLLDLLHSKNVEISRAVWFLRVIGANETVGLRNKASYNPVQYSTELANLFTGYLKKQLADIALPSAPRAGLNIKQTFKGILSDLESREHWISRFSYSLRLLRSFYGEGLVDNRSFLVWLVQQMSTCNLAQACFVSLLSNEYLDDLVQRRALVHHFVLACLNKLAEISCTGTEALKDTRTLLSVLLQRISLVIPDVFVSPMVWIRHSAELRRIMTEDLIEDILVQYPEHSSRILRRRLSIALEDIQQRNESMLLMNIPKLTGNLASAMRESELLNSISGQTDLVEMRFFDESGDGCTPKFTAQLNMLLTWSVSPVQYGDHRPFAAATLIRHWRSRTAERATRHNSPCPDGFLQDRLFDWLDDSDIAGDTTNLSIVALLYGKLIQFGLFSYSKYIQRLIARGEEGLAVNQEPASRHREFLRAFPLYDDPSKTCMHQRGYVLYGVAAARVNPEAPRASEIRKTIRQMLPHVFGGEPRSSFVSMKSLQDEAHLVISASRFEQVQIFRDWLVPILRQYIASQTNLEDLPNLVQTYSTVVELMVQCKCYHGIFDMSMSMLQHSTTPDAVTAVINTLRRFAVVWASMDKTRFVVDSLYVAHQRRKSKGEIRALSDVLVELDVAHYLDSERRKQLDADRADFSNALINAANTHATYMDDRLPDVLHLAKDTESNAAYRLANHLWITYARFPDWGRKVWSNVIHGIEQATTTMSDSTEPLFCAVRYGVFLCHIDQHLPRGLDEQVRSWLATERAQMMTLDVGVWDVLAMLLLHLVIHGALKTSTVLFELVFHVWGAQVDRSGLHEQREAALRAANRICRGFLVRDECTDDGSPPKNLAELQFIRTRRQDVYTVDHFRSMAAGFTLLVSLEQDTRLSQEVRDEATSLRRDLTADVDFRRATYSNLDIVREEFEKALKLTTDEIRNKHLIASFMKLLRGRGGNAVENASWPDVNLLLSPGQNAAPAVHFKFMLHRAGLKLDPGEGETAAAAKQSIDHLTSLLFSHSLTSEQAYFVAQLASGAGCAVASRFVNNGLRCIKTELQNSLKLGLGSFNRESQLLRVLAYVAGPTRHSGEAIQLEDAVIEGVLDVLHKNLVALLERLSTDTSSDQELSSKLREGVVILARIVQFSISFRGPWTQRTKETGTALADVIYHLAILHGAGIHMDTLAYPLLIDTLYFLVDEIPCESKLQPFDPFRPYPHITEIPGNLPPHYQRQLETFLSLFPPAPHVAQLAIAHRDNRGNIVADSPVLNRPWEWVESLESGSSGYGGAPDAEPHVRGAVKNAGSLSLEAFAARTTGDELPHKDADLRTQGIATTFQDGFGGDSLVERDFRETRTVQEDLNVAVTPTAAFPSMPKAGGGTGSRMSPGLATSSLRHSPASVVHSAVSDTDSTGTTGSKQGTSQRTSSKRKASAVSEVDVTDAAKRGKTKGKK
ncbi:hypothetical protein FISHEDRAFT_69221 [Fistulina hepatica ATCC 64428]|uniref:Mediator of RNA polymerase II transcription subunit 12 n=1 Tax=Fistulina hepatica ATCC 64428 TaxID=1128425 RepID=A0A0D7AMI2_9AGAR|nr:hypothetical protein FISHEDRAFT_69221 [Fistulina hepatica ATCC 64428]